MFNTAVMVSDTSSHLSHLWNLKRIYISTGYYAGLSPHLHHTAPHAPGSPVKHSPVQNRLEPARKEDIMMI